MNIKDHPNYLKISFKKKFAKKKNEIIIKIYNLKKKSKFDFKKNQKKMFTYLSKKIAIPNNTKLHSLSWSSYSG